MTTLHLISAASFAFVAVFTWHAYSAAPGVGQSPRSAIVEAWINILLGFSLNYVANLLILPLVGFHIGHVDNFLMGWVYTAVSIVRQYAIRRWFNARLHSLALRLGGPPTT